MQVCSTKFTGQQVSLHRSKHTTARRSHVSVQATANNKSSSRRSAGLMLVSMPMFFAVPAFARDAEKAKAAAESRKEALAKAAEEMRESGKTASAFSESQYAVSEDKSPNVHTRQEEGVRESAD
ncbi:hypothetical protein ABBQ38_010128 [Trebouxia sp. C0009 RCD-2024]